MYQFDETLDNLSLGYAKAPDNLSLSYAKSPDDLSPCYARRAEQTDGAPMLVQLLSQDDLFIQ